MPRIPSYKKLTMSELKRIIESGYSKKGKYTLAQAERAAEEYEARQMSYQEHFSRVRDNPIIRTPNGETRTVDDADFKWFVSDFISRNREAGVAFSVLRELGGSATLNRMQVEFPDRLVLMKGVKQLYHAGLVEQGGLGPGGNRIWRFVNR